MEWIIENWQTLGVIGMAIVTAASAIAKLTPTETDDKVVAAVLRFIDALALNNKPTELKK